MADPTPIFGISRFDDSDTSELDVLLNAHATDLEAALLELRSQGSSAVADQAERDSRFPSPAQGNRVVRLDLGFEEMYFAAYNSSTNPGGVTAAEWYPVAGRVPWIRLDVNGLSIPNDTDVALGSLASYPWTETSDRFGFHDAATNTNRITPNRPGVYVFHINSSWTFSGSGGRTLALRPNGSGADRYRRAMSASTDGGAGQEVQYEAYFNGSTDYVDVLVRQGSGGTLAVTATLTGRYVRPE